MQDAEDGDAGLHQKLPVAVQKSAQMGRPFGFTKHQASLIRGEKRPRASD